MGKCLSVESKWRCGNCMAKNHHDAKACAMCFTPKRWVCDSCKRLNPGVKKACLYCFTEYSGQQGQRLNRGDLNPNEDNKPKVVEIKVESRVESKEEKEPEEQVDNKIPTDNDQQIENKVIEEKKENHVHDPNENKKQQQNEPFPAEKEQDGQDNQRQQETVNGTTKTEENTEDAKTQILNNIQERRIAVIGKHPHETTRFCNWIIGMNVFQKDVNNCQQAQVKLFRKKMKIAKTPDPSSIGNPLQTIKKCLNMLSPGPHIFLQLVSVDNFADDDLNDFKQLTEWLGDKVYSYLIPVFFSKASNDLSDEDVQHLLSQNDALNDCVEQCGNRFVGGAIFSSGQKKVKYLRDLTEKIDTAIVENIGEHYVQEASENGNENEWDMVLNSYREIAGVVNPEDVQILVKTEGPVVPVDPEKQLDRLKRGLDKLSGQVNTPL